MISCHDHNAPFGYLTPDIIAKNISATLFYGENKFAKQRIDAIKNKTTKQVMIFIKKTNKTRKSLNKKKIKKYTKKNTK
ncbi:TPA: hypothetical protein LLS86_003655 [Serratia liquefaciens]|nr:hypothetical protein [Serratia liquefaciens]